MAEKEKKEPLPKTLTQDERKRLLIEGIKKTVLPAFISAGFALLFFLKKYGTEKVKEVPWFFALLVVALVSYYVQRLVYPKIGVRIKEFGAKDWLYVEFLVIIYLLVFWTLLLNTP